MKCRVILNIWDFFSYSVVRLNEIDEAIIRVLERKAKLSSRALSSMLHVPISTVHRRIQRLERNGTIIGYKALINYEATDRPISALIMINLAEAGEEATHTPKKDVLDRLKRLSTVEEIVEVQAASFDVIVKGRFESLRKLSEFVDELRSVNGIDSLITEGVYSVVRHPLYIADVILAWSVFFFLPFSRVLTEAIWMTFVLWFWAGLEERALEDRFLEDYREYKKKVPKFLPQWRKRDS